MKILLACLACAAVLVAQQKSGIDPSSLDPKCKPCDDFWRYANGGWLDRNPIPARSSVWGTLSVMTEANRERLRTILETAASSQAAVGSNERKIGDFYQSCMDTVAIDAAGLEPVKPYLDRIVKIADAGDVASALVAFQALALDIPTRAARNNGSGIGPFGIGATQDYKKSTDTIVGLGPGGLSLPERDYYFKTDEKSVRIREAFLKHVAATFELAGDSPDAASTGAQAVLALETSFADATMNNVQRRDPNARYHLMDWAGVSRLAPSIDWPALVKLLALPAGSPVNVTEPAFFERVQARLTGTPVAEWKTWLRWRVLRAAASGLAKPFEEEAFRFESVLTGVTEPLPRWQRCANAVDGTMGDALGQVFVAKHFPARAKQRMSELVENLRATLKEELEHSDWMTPETRRNAVAKLSSFQAKIGYPDRWRDYSAVTITPKSFLVNINAAGSANQAYALSKIGKPLDRNDWGMTPPTVNAYYNSLKNEIAFPAGILQPPLFDLEADDAVNYGAIAAVIGHEMGHGFDDQGSKFDAEGNLKNWWTADDRTKFETRASCVSDQFNSIDVGDGLRHNGKLVLGEALGDLGGLMLAFKAYQRSLKGKPGPAIDGFTPEQRFFLSFARAWGSNIRPEAMRLRLNTDPHPLAKYRANATLQNIPEFHKAFQCKRGDAMVRPPEQQCRLW
jgi:endothelin-converting enzyme/putative endopeptidase